MSLKSTLILRFSLGLIFAAAMLFIPAGSLNFWQVKDGVEAPPFQFRGEDLPVVLGRIVEEKEV
jgi:hypothetical protein